MGEQPLFYVAGRRVFKRPDGRKNADGSTTWTVGFPVCELTDWASDDAAEAIAVALNDLFHTPAPWRRTHAQQVQDLHLEVHRWRERARAAEARLTQAEAATASVVVERLRELTDVHPHHDHISRPVSIRFLKRVLAVLTPTTTPRQGQSSPASAASGPGASQPGPEDVRRNGSGR